MEFNKNNSENKSSKVSNEYLTALKTLSPREVEILERVALGHTSKEIGHELGISYRTIQKYRENIGKKLNLKGYRSLYNWCCNNIHTKYF